MNLKEQNDFALKMMHKYNTMSAEDQEKIENTMDRIEDHAMNDIYLNARHYLEAYGFRLLDNKQGTGFCYAFRYVNRYTQAEIFQIECEQFVVAIPYNKEA